MGSVNERRRCVICDIISHGLSPMTTGMYCILIVDRMIFEEGNCLFLFGNYNQCVMRLIWTIWEKRLRLDFNMGIPIPGKDGLDIETVPFFVPIFSLSSTTQIQGDEAHHPEESHDYFIHAITHCVMIRHSILYGNKLKNTSPKSDPLPLASYRAFIVNTRIFRWNYPQDQMIL